MNENTKRWILSTLITFVAGFSIAVLPQIDTLSMGSLQDGAVVGLVFAGVRAGFKAVLELFIAWYSQK